MMQVVEEYKNDCLRNGIQVEFDYYEDKVYLRSIRSDKVIDTLLLPSFISGLSCNLYNGDILGNTDILPFYDVIVSKVYWNIPKEVKNINYLFYGMVVPDNSVMARIELNIESGSLDSVRYAFSNIRNKDINLKIILTSTNYNVYRLVIRDMSYMFYNTDSIELIVHSKILGVNIQGVEYAVSMFENVKRLKLDTLNLFHGVSEECYENMFKNVGGIELHDLWSVFGIQYDFVMSVYDFINQFKFKGIKVALSTYFSFKGIKTAFNKYLENLTLYKVDGNNNLNKFISEVIDKTSNKYGCLLKFGNESELDINLGGMLRVQYSNNRLTFDSKKYIQINSIITVSIHLIDSYFVLTFCMRDLEEFKRYSKVLSGITLNDMSEKELKKRLLLY